MEGAIDGLSTFRKLVLGFLHFGEHQKRGVVTRVLASQITLAFYQRAYAGSKDSQITHHTLVFTKGCI